MPTEGQVLFRTREEIYADLVAAMQAQVPDVYLGDEGVVRILFEVMSGVMEAVFLANQIVSEDMYVQTSSPAALDRHGEERGLPRKLGTGSSGTLRFSGAGGVVIPVGAEVAYDSGTGDDPLYFNTTGSGTIPNPGIPTAPTLADAGAGVIAAGTYEYAVTFVTAAGETELGAESAPITIAVNHSITLTAIPLGGAGTTARKVYRSLNGGAYQLVTTINNNTTTTITDNNAGPLTGTPPVDSTAEAITISAASEDSGIAYNVLPGAITQLTDVPDGVTDVTNPAAFTGGTDPENTEDYRVRLLDAIRNPQTGSPADVKSWAEEVDGVETATVFANDNLGTPTNGHVTVRISGPGGTVPGTPVINAVAAALAARDIANITFHVATFTATSTDVAVTTTIATGYTLSDITPAVQQAITNYINALQVGETFRIAGVYDAVFGLPGVLDVVVTSPASNQATGATSKRTPGTITVS